MLQLDCENRFVPAGIFSEFIVCQNVGADLILRQVFETDCGNFIYAKCVGGLNSSMACDDHPVAINQNRIGESELLNATSNLLDLVF